ncbi:hypothetical protein FVEN_g2000 [Fusarium venenatum]|uniref:ATP-grasp domain-containing protein n=1 Tax=Fusarium venenatum TaxID=56646 RepID=A0A2L2T6V8_9HYPO|nr:uncharacterized protein FVRRES_12409 [Fusarium venenatum]KAG8360249.1 hypothetical protein FVEN_g2000 [Fusarium venenatum]CEI39718.1 unnamed protein product [Fusarium venenatum]
MTNPETSRVTQFTKNLSLFLLSFIFLPTNLLFALTAFLWNRLTSKPPTPTSHSQNDQDNLDKTTILVTGVNMAKGLSLARMFHRRGHRVIGADCYSLSPGRVSRAIDVYYRLPVPSDPSTMSLDDPYLNRITEIIKHEDVDLWVSVSDVNAAIEDAAVKEIIEARTSAKAIQFGIQDIRRLHEKDAFIEHTKSLGLTVPHTEAVQDKEDVINFLQRNGGLELKPGARQYLVKPVGVDDVARFTMPLLPLSSEDATLARIDTIPFDTAKCSFIIQEYITGPEFCTHALIIRGRVCAFVACRSADVLMHYSALPADSPLSKAMLDFTLKQAEEGGENFTGHMSFDFLINQEDEDGTRSGAEKDVTIYPIECNPRVHTATVLFNNTPEIVDEYLSVLSSSSERRSLSKPPLYPINPQDYYWVSQDLIELVLCPFYHTLFRGTTGLSHVSKSIHAFAQHLIYWKDGTFESWDPMPWLWMMHVYWPVQFAWYMSTGSVWTKLNVSTGKAFKG